MKYIKKRKYINDKKYIYEYFKNINGDLKKVNKRVNILII